MKWASLLCKWPSVNGTLEEAKSWNVSSNVTFFAFFPDLPKGNLGFQCVYNTSQKWQTNLSAIMNDPFWAWAFDRWSDWFKLSSLTWPGYVSFVNKSLAFTMCTLTMNFMAFENGIKLFQRSKFRVSLMHCSVIKIYRCRNIKFIKKINIRHRRRLETFLDQKLNLKWRVIKTITLVTTYELQKLIKLPKCDHFGS